QLRERLLVVGAVVVVDVDVQLLAERGHEDVHVARGARERRRAQLVLTDRVVGDGRAALAVAAAGLALAAADEPRARFLGRGDLLSLGGSTRESGGRRYHTKGDQQRRDQ